MALTLLSGSLIAGPLNDLQKNIANHKGDVIYLDFWASWCAPCRKSFPWLENISRKYSHKGLHVISVNVDSEHSQASDFLRKYPASFDVIYDPNGKVAEHYKLQGMPTVVILNRNGILSDSHIGFFESRVTQYESQLQKLLGSKS